MTGLLSHPVYLQIHGTKRDSKDQLTHIKTYCVCLK